MESKAAVDSKCHPLRGGVGGVGGGVICIDVLIDADAVSHDLCIKAVLAAAQTCSITRLHRVVFA